MEQYLLSRDEIEEVIYAVLNQTSWEVRLPYEEMWAMVLKIIEPNKTSVLGGDSSL